MGLTLREALPSDEKQIMAMFTEYENSESPQQSDRFEGARDFEKLGLMNYSQWLEELEKNKDATCVPSDRSPQTLYFAFNQSGPVGVVSLRWKENPTILSYGGSIGYSIRPTERGKGYATQMVRAALREFRMGGKEKALIACRDSNAASKRVIEKCGGEFAGVYKNENTGYTVLRYWVYLDK